MFSSLLSSPVSLPADSQQDFADTAINSSGVAARIGSSRLACADFSARSAQTGLLLPDSRRQQATYVKDYSPEQGTYASEIEARLARSVGSTRQKTNEYKYRQQFWSADSTRHHLPQHPSRHTTEGGNILLCSASPLLLLLLLLLCCLAVVCSLAPSGAGFKLLYYVSQPQGRGKSSRELMRETSEKRTRVRPPRRVSSRARDHSSLPSITPTRYY